MSELAKILAGLLVLGGAGLMATAGIGLLRLPDFYARTHAASLAGVLGTGSSLLALALFADELGQVLRAVIAILFFALTTPLSAHLLAKAARRAGYAPSKASESGRPRATKRGLAKSNLPSPPRRP